MSLGIACKNREKIKVITYLKFFAIMFPQCFATLSVVFIVEHLHHFLLYNRWRHYTPTIGLKFHGIPKKNFLHPDSQSGSFDHCCCLFCFALKKPSWYFNFFQIFEILPSNNIWSANDGAVKTCQEPARNPPRRVYDF